MLVEPKELAKMIEEGSTVVFDCRFSLAKPNQGFADYLSGHIPGAHYLHLDHDLSTKVGEHGGRHPLPDMAEFAAKVAQAGVSVDKTVVVYDAGGGMAPRAWWLFEYAGHPDVRVLNGGYQAWLAATLPVSAEVPEASPGTFEASVQEHMTVTVEDVRKMVAGDDTSLLVDARAEARFRGDTEPLDKVAGHIPGALNKPWDEGVDEEGRWRGASEQRHRFSDALSSHRPLVMYCGSGVTACANLFALRIAGVDNVKLYPGSWSDWCSYPEHPVETTKSSS